MSSDVKDDDRMRGQAWGDGYGLIWIKENLGWYSLGDLLSPKEQVFATKYEHDAPRALLLDHAMRFKRAGQRGPSRTVVIVTSPYISSLESAVGDPGTVSALAFDMASSLGLQARVGFPGDAVYFGGNPPNARLTLPIVWWNPAHFAMPYPRQD